MAQDSKDQTKEEKKEKQYIQIKGLIKSETYEFQGRFAHPQRGARG